MNNAKQIFVIAAVGVAILIAFALPKPKYQTINILSQLNIPMNIGDWEGKDVSEHLDLNDDRYRFISDMFARTYTRKDGTTLLFLMVNVDNFHPPKACFTSSGFKIRELNDTVFAASEKTPGFNAKTLFARKTDEGYVITYWININGRIEPNWVGGETKQLLANMLNQKRVGIMVRLDIPSAEHTTESSLQIAKDFVHELAKNLSSEQLQYIIGTY